MTKGIIIPLLMFCAGANAPAQDFMAQQKRYPRVRQAFEEKEGKMAGMLAGTSTAMSNVNVMFVAYKAEKILEVWVKPASKETDRGNRSNTGNANDTAESSANILSGPENNGVSARTGKAGADMAYRKMAEYKICRSSGKLGPKRIKGDGQVPEGFYHIDRFNPASSYHLSLGIDYPNKADRIRSGTDDPGGDIFIHGSCVTIGCLPMTDDKIKEIYILVAAKNNGQDRIPVYIFPFRMNDANMRKYCAMNSDNPGLIRFWESLKKGYELFASGKPELRFRITNKGEYSF